LIIVAPGHPSILPHRCDRRPAHRSVNIDETMRQ
jgi:hypothetical protein